MNRLLAEDWNSPEDEVYDTMNDIAHSFLTDGETVVTVKFEDCVGAARCHPDDEFDFNLGYDLALSRAMDKRATILRARAGTLRRMTYQRIDGRESE